jgi:7-carboxy-7-deazaguanine synthase
MSELTVAEVFGPTVQGEGPSSGRRAVFLRLGLCNLDCGAGDGATWECDTPYTWDWTGKLGRAYQRSVELRRRDTLELADQLAELDTDLVVVTGGEPMLQQKAIVDLIDALPGHVVVEVETNGTVVPSPEMRLRGGRVTYNVSPKLPNSGVDRDRAINPDALAALAATGARFKFVCADQRDLDDVAELIAPFPIRREQVWVMPAGTDPEVLTGRAGALADEVVSRGWNLSQRLHVMLWGNRRGV